MEKLIFLVLLFAFGAIANWFKKLKPPEGSENQSPDEWPGTPGSASPPRQSPGATSWEDELRRLLDNQPAAPPPPVRRPPPVVIASPVRTAPPPVAQVIRPLPVSPPRAAPVFVAPAPSVVRSGTATREFGSLSESKSAYEKASGLDATVSQHIQSIPGQPVQSTIVVRSEVSPELAQAVSLFKTAQTARQAVIASIILGPPRSLDEFAA